MNYVLSLKTRSLWVLTDQLPDKPGQFIPIPNHIFPLLPNEYPWTDPASRYKGKLPNKYMELAKQDRWEEIVNLKAGIGEQILKLVS